jgi:hypothetical protein
MTCMSSRHHAASIKRLRVETASLVHSGSCRWQMATEKVDLSSDYYSHVGEELTPELSQQQSSTRYM